MAEPEGASRDDAVPLRAADGTPLVPPRTVSAAVAIASAVFARGGAPPPDERLAYLAREIEDFLARSGPRARAMLSVLVWVVVLVAPWFIGKLGPLGALSPAERVRALDRLERRFGEPLVAVKAILCLLYYEHPDAAREVGFDGECHSREHAVIVEGRLLDRDVDEFADVVVVGSGAGGAVVAAHLAEAGQRVIVVEEGPHVPHERYGKMRPSESLRRLWRDGGSTVAIGVGNTPVINVMMGECVGGSSVLTGGVCFRAPGSVLAHWADDLRLSGLSEAAMEPYFDDVERAVHVEEVPVALRSRSTTAFVRGAERLGLPILPMRRNTRGCHGCGRCNFGCPEDAKLSVDRTYLRRAVAAGARIFSDARVERVVTRGARATGVAGHFRRSPTKPKFVVRAERVVLAAGAYCTPLLLERSGVGKRSEQVGKNLTLHPSFRVMARFDERIDGWKGALQSAYCRAFEHERIHLNGLFVPPGILAGTMPGIGDRHAERAALIPHLAVFGGMIHDEGGGRVHHAFGRRFITYRLSLSDSAAVSRTLSLLGEIFLAAGARELILPILGFDPVGADAFRKLDFDRIPRRRLESSSQHPLGTARMGVSADHAVVDPHGQSWELENLFVADGSVMPTSLGVNPQETIMAMATRIAFGLRERARPGRAMVPGRWN